MKQVILGELDQRKTINHKILIADLTLEDLKELGDFATGGFKAVWDNEAVKSVTIAMYTDTNGHQKRRFGASLKALSKDEAIDSFEALAKTLGIKIERTLEIYSGGKK